MFLRLKKLAYAKLTDELSAYANVMNIFKTIFMLGLKHSVTSNPKLLNKIIHNFESGMEQEVAVLNTVVRKLSDED